jgi:PhnB protein
MANKKVIDGDRDATGGSGSPRVRSIPEGYHAVSPWVITRDTDQLLGFLKRAFAAEEIGRVLNPDGSIGHAEARIGDSVVLMFDAGAGWPETRAFLRLYVADADAVYQRAIDAGATAVTRLTTLFFGDRVGRVCDPLGNVWWIQTHVEDVTPEELERRAQDPDQLASMRYVQDSLNEYIKSPPRR